MHLVLDVHYGDGWARGACVAFENAEDDQPAFVLVERFEGSAKAYEPGDFRTRELPYLERLVHMARERCSSIETVLVDGYVWLGRGRAGLGGFLYEALGRSVPVIGVAKTRFRGAEASEVQRGQSRSPLFITTAGLERSEGAKFVASMHGSHRMPTLLRRADRASRGDESPGVAQG